MIFTRFIMNLKGFGVYMCINVKNIELRSNMCLGGVSADNDNKSNKYRFIYLVKIKCSNFFTLTAVLAAGTIVAGFTFAFYSTIALGFTGITSRATRVSFTGLVIYECDMQFIAFIEQLLCFLMFISSTSVN